jgi:hypothetical protein
LFSDKIFLSFLKLTLTIKTCFAKHPNITKTNTAGGEGCLKIRLMEVFSFEQFFQESGSLGRDLHGYDCSVQSVQSAACAAQ